MAATEYYDHISYPAFGSLGSSAPARAEFTKIEVGFGKMPDLAGNGSEVVVIKADASGMETVPTTGTGNIVRATDPTFVLTDVLTNNATTLQHGWLPKLSGSTSQFLRGDGNWASPPTFSLLQSDRTSNTILASGDSGTLIKYTSGTFSQTITAAATLGAGWFAYLWNDGTGLITVDPNGAETINGAATYSLNSGRAILLVCTGTAFSAVLLQDNSNHEVVVHTGLGRGSTNTGVRRFSTTLVNLGTAITYADSATLGGTFTINETGLYSLSYVDFDGAADGYFAISLNSAQLTSATGPNQLAIATRLVCVYNVSVNIIGPCAARVVRLTAGDVIRAHVSATWANTNDQTIFAIRKVG